MEIRFFEVGVGAAALVLVGAALQGALGQQSDEAEAKAQQAKCISNMRILGSAFQLYLGDHDDAAPLSVPRAGGQYASSRQFTAPSARMEEMARGAGWLWAAYPYIMSRSALLCPSASSTEPLQKEPGATSGPIETSYTYNGLLHAFPSPGIEAPAELTVFWEGWGDTYDPRTYGSNPQLNCHDGSPPCIYAGTQGPSGLMFRPRGTMWIHNGGFNSTYADSHAKWKRVGAQVSPAEAGPPFTDYRVDPFTGYDENGKPGWYWEFEMHPLMFAPDFDFHWGKRDSATNPVPKPRSLKSLSTN